MREQHWTKSEHPLPYIFLFNRDTYSVKRKIHTDMFLFERLNRYYWLTSSILTVLEKQLQRSKLVQRIKMGIAVNCLNDYIFATNNKHTTSAKTLEPLTSEANNWSTCCGLQRKLESWLSGGCLLTCTTHKNNIADKEHPLMLEWLLLHSDSPCNATKIAKVSEWEMGYLPSKFVLVFLLQTMNIIIIKEKKYRQDQVRNIHKDKEHQYNIWN